MIKYDYVIVSGGFDPIHVGHLDLFKEASLLGKLIVIVNNDIFLKKKKSYSLMLQEDRIKIINEFKCVYATFLSIDKDHTVSKSIEKIHRIYNGSLAFLNGGDRRNINDVPESKICKKLDIDMIFNIGGHKTRSSSQLVQNVIIKS